MKRQLTEYPELSLISKLSIETFTLYSVFTFTVFTGILRYESIKNYHISVLLKTAHIMLKQSRKKYLL